MVFLYVILSKYEEKSNEIEKKIDGLNKRFKTMEELNDIRLDIREIQKKVFKNG